MSIFNDKALKSVAEAAAKIMEQEASHPKTEKEKKLAAMGHPKDKITHKDVLIGRGVLKKEEAELDEEEKMKGEDPCWKGYEMIGHKMKGGRKVPNCVPKSEEVEQKGELINEAAYSAKAARAGKDIGKPGKMFGKIAAGAAKRYGSEERGRKVAGAVLKKLRMKEDTDIEITDEQAEEILEAFEYDQENQMSFSEMLAAYKEHGLKTLVAEEPDNEQFTKELKDQEASMMGKKKQPSVAAPATQGVKNMPEEVEVIDLTDVNQVKEYTIQMKDLQEKTLTEPETKKKEEVVKSMKKKLPGFKERYGERAKSVMYATATKIAKEKA